MKIGLSVFFSLFLLASVTHAECITPEDAIELSDELISNLGSAIAADEIPVIGDVCELEMDGTTVIGCRNKANLRCSTQGAGCRLYQETGGSTSCGCYKKKIGPTSLIALE